MVQCEDKWKSLECITLNIMKNFHLLLPIGRKGDIVPAGNSIINLGDLAKPIAGAKVAMEYL